MRFAYGPSRARYVRIDDNSDNGKDKTTRYLGAVERTTHSDGSVQWKRQIGAAVFTLNTNSSHVAIGDVEQLYALKDHLGSTDLIVDALGSVVNSFSFDAFGQRRNTRSGAALTSSQLPALSR